MEMLGIGHIASQIALTDDDLNGDSVVEKIRELKAGIVALEVDLKSSAPWLILWLTDEHYCGSVLYAAAKANKDKWGANESNPTGPKSRAAIVARFNSWASRLPARIGTYQQEPNGATVQPWRDSLEQFKQNPIANAG